MNGGAAMVGTPVGGAAGVAGGLEPFKQLVKGHCGLQFEGDDATRLAQLRARGVRFVHVTLHVGAGTFLPVKVEDVTTHRMHGEWGEVTPEAAQAINDTRAAGGRVIPVGTTALRLIESARLLDMVSPYTAEEIDRAKEEVLNANGFKDAYVRAVMWRGSGEDMGVSARRNPVRMAVAAWEWGSYYGDAKWQGAKLDIAKWKRPSPETIPTAAKAAGLYMICTISKPFCVLHWNEFTSWFLHSHGLSIIINMINSTVNNCISCCVIHLHISNSAYKNSTGSCNISPHLKSNIEFFGHFFNHACKFF